MDALSDQARGQAMWRNESVGEISDGRYYTANDMVRIGTDDCAGCSDCCRMDPLIVLDPCDAFEFNRFLGESVEDLLNEKIRLEVIDGLILPVLQMDENGTCPFLGEDGRCTIHLVRPGICRLYPLGRSWEDGDFRYILQVHECTHCTGAKVKVKKWIQIPDLSSYEEFCRKWHNFLEQVRGFLESADPEGTYRRQICVYLLRQFYLCDWTGDDFYALFEEKLAAARQHLGFAS